MFKSKLIRLYQSLDKAEIRQLKKWVYSPMHNQHEDVQKLFEFLFTRASITKVTTNRERAFDYLYPQNDFHMPRLRHVMSFATDVLESFIRFKEALSDSKKSDVYLLQGFRRRNLKKEATQKEKSLHKILKKSRLQNANHYLLQLQLEEEVFLLEAKRERPTKTNLQELLDATARFFVIKTLHYACSTVTHQNLFNTEYRVPFLESIIQEIEGGAYQEDKGIQIYFACYQAITQMDNHDYFEQLKQYLQDYTDVLTKEEFRGVYNLAINYCIKQLNTGNKQYIKEAFDLYMNGLGNQFLYDEEGYISRFAYKNIVALGLNLKRFEEIEAFIPKGEALLEPNYRKSYVPYNKAKFHFAKKEYNKAVQLLIQTDFDDLFMNLDAKMMLLMMYTEEEAYDLLESFLNSFSQYLRRKKIMSYHQSNYSNIIRLTRKLIHVYTSEQKEALAKEIENTSPLTEKRWLLEQLGVEFLGND